MASLFLLLIMRTYFTEDGRNPPVGGGGGEERKKKTWKVGTREKKIPIVSRLYFSIFSLFFFYHGKSWYR
jgi:hypothetical protein